MKNKKIFLIFFLLIVVFGLVAFQEVQAVGELKASIPVRISHPAHSYTTLWATERNPWNADYTKIMMYELSSTHPNYTSPRVGKGLVFGVLADLPTLASMETDEGLAAYEASVKPIGGLSQTISTYTEYAVWSMIQGEENIIYAVSKNNEYLYRIDTGIDPIVPVYWMSLSDSDSVTVPYLLGWTTDKKLIMYNSYDRAAPWEIIEIDVAAKAKSAPKEWPQNCGSGTADINRYPSRIPNEIHGTWSADRTLYFRYSGSTGGNDGICDGSYGSSTCVDSNICYNNGSSGTKLYYDQNSSYLTHIATMDNVGIIGTNSGNDFLTHNAIDVPPYLTGFTITQVIFDRTTHTFTPNILVDSFIGAGFRWTSVPGANLDHNYYGGHASPSLRPDNGQLMFISTGGKYSVEDREYCAHFNNVPSTCSMVNINTNYGMYGVFLANLSLADTTPPAPPSGVSVQ